MKALFLMICGQSVQNVHRHAHTRILEEKYAVIALCGKLVSSGTL